jgi:hypothetical protein
LRWLPKGVAERGSGRAIRASAGRSISLIEAFYNAGKPLPQSAMHWGYVRGRVDREGQADYRVALMVGQLRSLLTGVILHGGWLTHPLLRRCSIDRFAAYRFRGPH